MATVLELSLDQLFTLDPDPARPNGQEGGHGVLIGRHNSRPHRVRALGVRWESLASPEGPLRFGLVTYDAGVSTTVGAPPLGHDGIEHAYLLSGTLVRTVGTVGTVGTDQYQLATGDSFELDARVPHALFNPGPHPTNLLWVLDPNTDAPPQAN